MCSVLPACISPCKAPNLIKDGWEPSCHCWALNLGPLKEQPILTSEPSLQSRALRFLKTCYHYSGCIYVWA